MEEPNPDEWLDYSEDERIDSVKYFHENFDDFDFESEQALTAHCGIHVIVENQVALNVEYVPQTLSKLMRQGLDRHDAIHAIGAILNEEIFKVLRGEVSELSSKRYRKKLDKITAKRWRKGQY